MQSKCFHFENRIFFPTSYAWWVLFSCRRAHNVSSKGNCRTQPKWLQFSKKRIGNLLEKRGRSIFDDCQTLLALFELQECIRIVCPLDFGVPGCLVPGPWSPVPGPRVPDPRSLVSGPWSLVPGPWSLVLGPWVPGPSSLGLWYPLLVFRNIVLS